MDTALQELPKEAKKALWNLRQLGPLDTISSLSMPLPVPNDALLFVNSSLKNLTEVTAEASLFSSDSFRCVNLAHLSVLMRVQSFKLTGFNLCGTEALVQFPSLKRLELRHCLAASPHWVQDVAKVTSLEGVTLHRCKPLFGDVELESFRSGLSNLKALAIDFSSSAQTIDFACLSGLSQLQSMKLSNVSFRQQLAGDSWEELHALKSISLDTCGPLSAIAQCLVEITSLQEISLQNCPVKDKFFWDIGSGRFALSKLTVRNCHVGSQAWAAISKMATLKDLTISSGRLSEGGVRVLAKGHFSLQALELQGSDSVTEKALQMMLCSQRRSLASLRLAGCRRVREGWFRQETAHLQLAEYEC